MSSVREPFNFNLISTFRYVFQVRTNWKKLIAGRLEGISGEYVQHLKAFGPRLIQGPPISSGAFHELTQAILNDHQRSLAPPKPAVKGTFGRIYSEYQSRLATPKPLDQVTGPDSDEAGKIVIDVKPGHLMSEEDDFKDLTMLRSPTTGTAMLNVQGIDPKLKREGHITLDKFRKKYLFANAKKQAQKGNKLSQVYLNWLKKVEQEEDTLLTGVNGQIGVSRQDMLPDANEDSFQVVQKYRHPTEEEVLEKEREELANRSPFVVCEEERDVDEKIEPIDSRNDAHNKTGVIQKGDCFYDTEGNFLHRVPGLVKYNRRGLEL